ncbi:PspC domain-containing protein [Flexivirga sp. ID2601S]|uniref:PspC domain-containing protein n=1 Tax=Flexivirga aerilata TaxID=1656889 RepID=A0A849ATI1_9MICO|nr:PspC domain-containing protein [Flexivirga aerilata]NNG40042.1 PspC domain-containing protein [Flexivirga aerilata]
MTQHTLPHGGGHGHGGAPRTGHTGAIDRFFTAIRGFGITRRRDGKWFGGVCAGLAARWGVDPLIVRAGFILATFLFGVGVPAYFLAWSLLPDEDGAIAAEKALRHGDISSIALCAVTALLMFSGFGVFWSFGSGWNVGGPAIGLGLLAWAFLAWNGKGPGARHDGETRQQWTDRLGAQLREAAADHRTHPAPGGAAPGSGAAGGATEPVPSQSAGNRAAAAGVDLRKPGAAYAVPAMAPTAAVPATPAASTQAWSRPAKRRTFGAGPTFAILGISVLAGAFTAAFLLGTSHGDSALQVGLAAGVAVAALALVIGGLVGRRGGALGPIASVVAVLAVITSLLPKGMPWTGEIGDEQWRPASVAAGTQHNFALKIGSGTIDLSRIDPAALPARTTLHARVNIGGLTIVPPKNVTLRVTSDVDFGGISVNRPGDDPTYGGVHIKRTVTVGNGPKTIDVQARVGMGGVEIKEAK